MHHVRCTNYMMIIIDKFKYTVNEGVIVPIASPLCIHHCVWGPKSHDVIVINYYCHYCYHYNWRYNGVMQKPTRSSML